MMKFVIFLLCALSFSFANECEEKILKLEKELEYAKKYDNEFKARDLENAITTLKTKCKDNPNFYKELLQIKQDKLTKLEALEKELDTLSDNQDSMPKAEYKFKKEKLKLQKDSLKQELKALELY
ncbi:DUF1090 domain-containing protein [Campylobacter upsaliensis]|uniref:DUF1090 family protein n=1 Tax=Campylobacter upsaliensis TaxID=28080 RepID=UPI00139D73A3|nr:DUF1090 family protein [Campylobacter upsaliensis]EAJ2125616.1 DUF1090 domain-containing protein [Campylobacter upsaliensis]EAJ5546092.1 DUF1090 domain-containing protein [Campylobacter upsaliensis]EDP6885864.1 DUF1090 family protein [Campylobacter upsaliensis]HEC1562383.1 DUF1090 family protein [Campylobacter upsaliensis]